MSSPLTNAHGKLAKAGTCRRCTVFRVTPMRTHEGDAGDLAENHLPSSRVQVDELRVRTVHLFLVVLTHLKQSTGNRQSPSSNPSLRGPTRPYQWHATWLGSSDREGLPRTQQLSRGRGGDSDARPQGIVEFATSKGCPSNASRSYP